MHKVLLTTIMMFCMLAIVAPASVTAQQTTFADLSQTEESAPVIKDVEGLRLELIQHTQNPANQEVKFDLVISPSFGSDRVQVTWQVIGVSEMLSETVQQISLQSNQPATVSITIRPRGLGVTDVRAKVEAFAADGTYSATASKVIGTFENGEVFPLTNEYRVAQVLILVRNIALVAVVLIGGYLLFRLVYRQLRARAFAEY